MVTSNNDTPVGNLFLVLDLPVKSADAYGGQN